MAVTSNDPQDQPGRRRAAIVSRAALSRQQPAVQRLLALGLLLVSVAGGVLWGGGGVAAWLSLAPSLAGAGAALAVQLVCTYVQWTHCDHWRNPYYLLALCVSTGTSLAGYWPLTHPALSGILGAAADRSAVGYYAPYLAGALIILAALLLDILPERILTR